jgi:hypothetical protein
VANVFIKAQKYVALALAALERDTVLPNVVTRFDGGVFKGAENDTVSFRLPGLIRDARDYEWRTRTAPIVLDSITRTKVDIDLDTHTYSAVPITDEELTLDISSFAEDVVLPQTNVVVDRLERKIAVALRAAPFGVTDLDAAESDDPYAWALSARNKLNAQGTPRANRQLLVGTNVETWLLSSDKLIKMDPSQATNAYREASLGRIAGFNIVASELLTPNEIFATHPSALVMANVAPEVPDGATYGAKRQFRGYGLRVLRDYDPNFARDRSLVSTFTGISSVNDQYEYDGGGLIVIGVDGKPTLTGFNARGGKGTFVPTA